VACEACHGPGSTHVAWARRQVGWRWVSSTQGLAIQLDERRILKWYANPGSGEVLRSTPRRTEREIQMCARCHSRRGQIHEDYVHGQEVGNDYRISLIESSLNYPDGRIKAEDYEYRSLIQGKIFHEGVTSSDCHDPHSLNIRADGNALCLRCHSSEEYVLQSITSTRRVLQELYALAAMCRHALTLQSTCEETIACGFRDPNNLLSLAFQNACTACHKSSLLSGHQLPLENVWTRAGRVSTIR
jgi:predicted CXXCH cytochrome family protein